MSGKNKGRKKAYKKVRKILDENGNDMMFAWHKIATLVNKELRSKKKK